MRIAPITNNYYNSLPTTPAFTSSENPKTDKGTDRLFPIWAAAALTSLAAAYGGGKMIIKDYEENMNAILDRYEKEIQEERRQLDSLYNEIKTIDFEEPQK